MIIYVNLLSRVLSSCINDILEYLHIFIYNFTEFPILFSKEPSVYGCMYDVCSFNPIHYFIHLYSINIKHKVNTYTLFIKCIKVANVVTAETAEGTGLEVHSHHVPSGVLDVKLPHQVVR